MSISHYGLVELFNMPRIEKDNECIILSLSSRVCASNN